MTSLESCDPQVQSVTVHVFIHNSNWVDDFQWVFDGKKNQHAKYTDSPGSKIDLFNYSLAKQVPKNHATKFTVSVNKPYSEFCTMLKNSYFMSNTNWYAWGMMIEVTLFSAFGTTIKASNWMVPPIGRYNPGGSDYWHGSKESFYNRAITDGSRDKTLTVKLGPGHMIPNKMGETWSANTQVKFGFDLKTFLPGCPFWPDGTDKGYYEGEVHISKNTLGDYIVSHGERGCQGNSDNAGDNHYFKTVKIAGNRNSYGRLRDQDGTDVFGDWAVTGKPCSKGDRSCKRKTNNGCLFPNSENSVFSGSGRTGVPCEGADYFKWSSNPGSALSSINLLCGYKLDADRLKSLSTTLEDDATDAAGKPLWDQLATKFCENPANILKKIKGNTTCLSYTGGDLDILLEECKKFDHSDPNSDLAAQCRSLSEDTIYSPQWDRHMVEFCKENPTKSVCECYNVYRTSLNGEENFCKDNPDAVGCAKYNSIIDAMTTAGGENNQSLNAFKTQPYCITGSCNASTGKWIPAGQSIKPCDLQICAQTVDTSDTTWTEATVTSTCNFDNANQASGADPSGTDPENQPGAETEDDKDDKDDKDNKDNKDDKDDEEENEGLSTTAWFLIGGGGFFLILLMVVLAVAFK